MLQNNKVNKLIYDLLNLPKHKIEYLIKNKTLVKGFIDTFSHYGIEYTQEVHEIVIEAVQEKLEGLDIEREWSEEEYENFVLLS